jgi:hypothetical protein
MNRQSRSIALAALTGLTTFAVGTAAWASDPTTGDCLSANESSIKLGSDHKLRDARAQLLTCSASTCPTDIRNACTRRMADVNAALPTIVFEAKDPSGNDLSAVTIAMDGKPLVDHLDGSAIPMDPGAHDFTFDVAGQPTAKKRLVIYEGEKNRRERIVIGTAAASGAVPLAADTSGVKAPIASVTVAGSPVAPDHAASIASSPSYWTGRRIGGVVATATGVVGVGVGGVIGLVAKQQYSTASGESGTARQTDSAHAVSAGNVATVVVCVGGALAAAGLVIWLTAPSAQTSVGTNGTEIFLRGSF